jgi:hypothetical protein
MTLNTGVFTQPDVKPSIVRRQLAIVKRALEIARTEWSIPIQHNPLAKL